VLTRIRTGTECRGIVKSSTACQEELRLRGKPKSHCCTDVFLLWAAIVPLYWSLAFVIAASIPDFFGLVSVVSAFCVIQFCYSFPPILALGYMMNGTVEFAFGELAVLAAGGGWRRWRPAKLLSYMGWVGCGLMLVLSVALNYHKNGAISFCDVNGEPAGSHDDLLS
jgi:hypothetical protein